jgi:hypothetical protein
VCNLVTLAGPAATIIAAIAAVSVTAYFAWHQKQIAKQQANTALDQLRYNLFEKRCSIYEAARKAIEITFERCDDDHMPVELNALFLKFDEARFFFSEPICFFLEQLHKDIRAFLQDNHNHRHKAESAKNLSQNVEVRKMLLEEEGVLLDKKTALCKAAKSSEDVRSRTQIQAID